MASKTLVAASDLFKTQRLYRAPAWALARLRRAGVRVVPESASAAADATIYWGNLFETAMLDRMPNLRWIHCASVGVNRAAVPAVSARGIVVTNSRGQLAAPVAAATVGFVCALARGFHHAWDLRARGRLDRAAFDVHFDEMRDLDGEKALVVGLGDIGSRVARALAALGMKVSAVRSRSGLKPRGVEKVWSLEELPRAAAGADFVINLLPLTAKTKRAFDARVFKAMKRSAYFVSTGRGTAVDENALIDALKKKRIAGAGLDVFEVEPLPAGSPLRRMPNVIWTPHVACLSVNYWPAQIARFEDNIRRFRAGKPLRDRVDLARGY